MKIYTVHIITTMERSTRLFAATLMLCILLFGSSTAGLNAQDGKIPQYLAYQGVLTDQNRQQVPDGQYTMTFKIYDSEQGGTPLWMETQVVETMDGVFDAYLGLTTPMTLAFNEQYWIAAQVQGEAEMEPRTRLVPAPYAFNAGHAATADELSGPYVKSINGQTGDVVLEVENPSLSNGAMWIGDATDRPSELPLGSANQVLNVKPDGTSAEWTSDLRLATIDVRSISTDSLFVRKYANFGGPTVFNDSVFFNGHVTLKFPPDNRLTYKAIPVGDANNKVSELLTTNEPGAILMQNADGTPSYSRNLNVWDVTINGTTNINSPRTTINSEEVRFGPVTSTTTFDGDVTFNKTPNIALPEGWMWRGGSTGFQEPYAPGNDGDVLTVIDGMPKWRDTEGGYLPLGTKPNATLTWNGTKWVENTNLTSDPTNGNTTVGGNLVVEGPAVDLPEASIDNFELRHSTINVNYGQGISGSAQVSLGNTLNIQNTGVVGVNGTPNQVSVSSTTGTVTLSTPQDIHQDAVPTFNGITLDNLTAGSTASQVLVSNGGNVETRTAASLFDEMSLSTGSMWVGNEAGKPAELNAGNVGQTLRISATGTPAWENVNELPDGTIINAPLVWNGTSWVQANNVTINPETGSIMTNGDVTVRGSLSGAGSNKFAGSVPIPMGISQLTIPYAGLKVGAIIHVTVVDDDPFIGIVPARVISVSPGTGFTVELAITYDSPTGKLHYIVVNP